MLKITNTLIKQEAENRGWNVDVLSEEAGLLRLVLPHNKKLIVHSSLSPFTPATAVTIADDKYATFVIAKEINVPVAETHRIAQVTEALDLLRTYGEIVIKPAGEAHGNGVSTQLKDVKQVESAFKIATEYKSSILVQPHLAGDDVRLLFIGSQLAAAAIRRPASILGDGKRTIREIVLDENSSGKRAPDYQKELNSIDVSAAERYLGRAIDLITEENKEYIVVGTANIGTGGTAEDITDEIQSHIVEDGLKILRTAGLATGAVDFIIGKKSHVLLEINANPSFGLHVYPSAGKSRDVTSLYLDWLVKEVA